MNRLQAESLLRRLADGAPHSGEQLAREFDVTRAAIWKQIGKLKTYGVDVEASPGSGYRLGQAIDWLDLERIGAELATATAARVEKLELFTELDSTNRYLLERAPPPEGKMHVCMAEFQRAGRGRRGRSWVTPIGGGLCLSAAWTFNAQPPDLSALGLAVGVVARRMIRRLVSAEIGLKWPNDLVVDERKLGGILVEMSSEANGGCHVVAGLGINVRLPEALLREVSDWNRGAVDLERAGGGDLPGRSSLAAALVDGLAELMAGYAETGFAPYIPEWQSLHVLTDSEVQVDDGRSLSYGTVRGIETDGALVLENEDGLRRRVLSGDVSVRPRP